MKEYEYCLRCGDWIDFNLNPHGHCTDCVEILEEEG